MTIPCVLLLSESDPQSAHFTDYLQVCLGRVSLVQTASQQEALAYLKTTNLEYYHFPNLVLLSQPTQVDLTGLRAIKNSYPRLPVVLLSRQLEAVTLAEAYRWGANAVMEIPIDLDQWRPKVEPLLHYWLEVVTLPAPPVFYLGS